MPSNEITHSNRDESCPCCGIPPGTSHAELNFNPLTVEDDILCDHHIARRDLTFCIEDHQIALNEYGPYTIDKMMTQTDRDGSHRNTIFICLFEGERGDDNALGTAERADDGSHVKPTEPELLAVDFNDNKEERFGLPTMTLLDEHAEPVGEDHYITNVEIQRD